MTSPLISYELAFSLTSKSSGDRISLLAERGSGDFIPLCRTCASHTVTASRSTGASRVRCRRSGKSPHTILERSRVESFRGETMDEGASRRSSAPRVEQQKSEAESRFVVVIANVYKFQRNTRNDRFHAKIWVYKFAHLVNSTPPKDLNLRLPGVLHPIKHAVVYRMKKNASR